MALLEVHDLRVAFHTRGGVVQAVNGASWTLEKGETLGVVGESGSGKSVSAYALMGLVPQPPGRIAGRALLGGVDLLRAPRRELAAIRGKRLAMIFQDPMTCLNPYQRVGDQIMEPLLIHEKISKATARERALEALREVGVPDPAARMRAWPHEFSGGMRQRVMIALALVTNPEVLLADEPAPALDVTVQAQILDLIKRLQRAHGTAVLFITHDLGVVSGFCDRVQVMYAGRILESAPTAGVFERPLHPYNRALQKSIPAFQEKGRDLYTIRGMPPDLSKPSPGCPFAPRCEFVRDACTEAGKGVTLEEFISGHHTACLRVQRGELQLDEAGVMA